ncbi:hypothetical protein pCXcHC2016_09 [Xenohaliotis phage pCXc-HC2016]|nr:hypothetical protein pCXcHC2016_09 [Xenohaliotis phage pCXc-HC2016]AQW89116.1 hypothetical protein pCXcHR2015_09 [Xenohaliotis phage pCXc-HR2015]
MSYSTKISPPTAISQTLKSIFTNTNYDTSILPEALSSDGSVGSILYNDNGAFKIIKQVVNDDALKSLASNGIISGIQPTKTMNFADIELAPGRARVNGKIIDFAGTTLTVPSNNTSKLLYVILKDTGIAEISTTEPTAQEILITAFLATGDNVKNLLFGGDVLNSSLANGSVVAKELGLIPNGFGFSFGATSLNSFGGTVGAAGRTFVIPKKENVALELFDDSSFLRELTTLNIADFKIFKTVGGTEQAISGANQHVIWFIFSGIGDGSSYSAVLPQQLYSAKPTVTDILLGFADGDFPRLLNGFAPVAALIVAGDASALVDIEVYPLARKRAGSANRATILLPRADEVDGNPNTAVLGIKDGKYEWRKNLNIVPADSDGMIATNNGFMYTKHNSGALAADDYYYAITNPLTFNINGLSGTIAASNIPSIDLSSSTDYTRQDINGNPYGLIITTNRPRIPDLNLPQSLSPLYYFQLSVDPQIGTSAAKYVLEVEFIITIKERYYLLQYNVDRYFRDLVIKAKNKWTGQVVSDNPLHSRTFSVYSHNEHSINVDTGIFFTTYYPARLKYRSASFQGTENIDMNEFTKSTINTQVPLSTISDKRGPYAYTAHCIYRFYKKP